MTHRTGVGIYDIRGKYPYEFDERTAEIATELFISALHIRGKKRPIVIIGRDTRTSSSKIAKAVISYVKKSGAEFMDIGLCTTPMMYFLTRRMGASLGLMITASHNPSEYNGLKVVSSGVESNLVDKIRKNSKLKPIEIYSSFLADFVDSLIRTNERMKNRPLRVVFDCSNGTSALVLEELLPKVNGLKYKIINARLSGKFPAHGPNPLKSSATNELSKAVLKEGADLGIIFDGDGDRAFFVDEKGKRIDTEIMGALIAEHLRAKTVVVEPTVGWTFKRSKMKDIQKIVVSPVGHDIIPKAMDSSGATFAFERSGHFYFKVSVGAQKFNFDSGILGAIFGINAVSGLLSREKTLSSYVSVLSGKYHRVHRDFRVKEPYEAIARIKKHFSASGGKGKGGKASTLDGLTIEYKDWWFNVRPSNTEPKIRLNVEANSKELVKKRFDEILAIIKKF